MNRAIFLDRDGTIARDVHYCRRPEDFEILPTVAEAIRLFNENGFKVVVVTNQSGLARGYFTEGTLSLIHDRMKADLARSGARINAVYYCPHHPDDGCACRKPRTALFERAARDMDIDLKQSFVIGDTAMDINAGKAIGARTILVTTGPDSVVATSSAAIPVSPFSPPREKIEMRGPTPSLSAGPTAPVEAPPGQDWRSPAPAMPEFVASDMLTAANWVLKSSERRVSSSE